MKEANGLILSLSFPTCLLSCHDFRWESRPSAIASASTMAMLSPHGAQQADEASSAYEPQEGNPPQWSQNDWTMTLPSGELTFCYGKWPLKKWIFSLNMVDFSMAKCEFTRGYQVCHREHVIREAPIAKHHRRRPLFFVSWLSRNGAIKTFCRPRRAMATLDDDGKSQAESTHWDRGFSNQPCLMTHIPGG